MIFFYYSDEKVYYKYSEIYIIIITKRILNFHRNHLNDDNLQTRRIVNYLAFAMHVGVAFQLETDININKLIKYACIMNV